MWSRKLPVHPTSTLQIERELPFQKATTSPDEARSAALRDHCVCFFYCRGGATIRVRRVTTDVTEGPRGNRRHRAFCKKSKSIGVEHYPRLCSIFVPRIPSLSFSLQEQTLPIPRKPGLKVTTLELVLIANHIKHLHCL